MPNNDSTISKILPFEFAADLLLNKELFFSRPSLWDDPFEKLNDTLNGKMIFAQCWCKTSYSDAMWRIFSQSKELKNYGPGIQIRTTIKKWKEAIKKSILNLNIILIDADIEYIKISEYKKTLYKNREEFLFKKRKAFKHELEHRFVLKMNKEVYKNFKCGNGVKIPLKGNIRDIIASIWIDPFSSPFLAKAIKNFFKEKEFSCKQSKIYTEPEEKCKDTCL